MLSTLTWLRGRTDEQLAALIAARPDVLVPAPGDFGTLARRLDAVTSVARALDTLDRFEMQVVQAALICQADASGTDSAAITALLGGPADRSEVRAALARLETAGLIRRVDGDGSGAAGTADDDGSGTADSASAPGRSGASGSADAHTAPPDTITVPTAVRDGLGRFPAGLGPATGLSPDDVSAALGRLGDDGRALLQRLVPGPPVGTFTADSPSLPLVDSLVAAGLLTRVDRHMVLLPREVSLALRGEQPLSPAHPAPPDTPLTEHDPKTVDGTAAGQALAAHARAAALISIIGDGSITELKSGGISIVMIRRLAKQSDTDIHTITLHFELLHAAGLITPVMDRAGRSATWTPTQAADTFLAGEGPAGWSLLAETWLSLRRNAALVGSKDARDKVRNALSAELDWRSGPSERRRVLGELVALPDGSGLTAAGLAARLSFRMPRRDPATVQDLAQTVLTEATELGIVAFDAISGAGRALIADDIEGAAAAVEAAAPPVTDRVVVQADMTVIATGRLSHHLDAELRRAADVESAGGATVFRVSPESIRRALDTGIGEADLHRLFTQHSVTDVPQSLTYLIDDVARRHGVLRAGDARSFVHCADPALVAQAVAAAAAAGITLRTLAPTVAVSPIEMEVLVDVLRAAGMAPAAEDASGAVIDLSPPPRRARITPPARYRYVAAPAASAEQIAAVIARLRAEDGAGPVQTAADLVAVLREAADRRGGVWIRYADAQGNTSRRIVEPVVVAGGTMIAFDRLRRAPQTFPIHRITSATPE